LFGPERICSVRNAVINVCSRSDVVVLNSTLQNAISEVRMDWIAEYARKAKFCLVAKGGSYSTSFFYLALAYGCIPLVISDWFTFIFPWLVPYERFVVRVSEEDWLPNPEGVLDWVHENLGNRPLLLEEMRRAMAESLPLLQFEPVPYSSLQYARLMQRDTYLANNAEVRNTAVDNNLFLTHIPLELMLLEIRYSQEPHRFYNNIPCLRPNMCSQNYVNVSYRPTAVDYIFPVKSKVRKLPVVVLDSAPIDGAQQKENVAYEVAADGYQVNPLYLPTMTDLRPHLCRHINRLIGSYKVVYYMQCVRILWPLKPGEYKPVDNVQRFNLSSALTDGRPGVVMRYRGGTYSTDPEGISFADIKFVDVFHKPVKPVGYTK
jgi:hypothetical protein